MSKQPKKTRTAQRLLRAKSTLFLPEQRNPKQCWFLVRREAGYNNQPGCFFVTHAENAPKFDNKRGCTLIGYSYDRAAIRLACRQATLSGGANYQPKFSQHFKPLVLEPQEEPPEDYPDLGQFADPENDEDSETSPPEGSLPN